jgi:hypothetical protein
MIRDYKEKYCWQYNIRLNNLTDDLVKAGLTIEETEGLKISDFVFQYREKNTCFEEIKNFIERHEWLGRISLYPTHIFTARYKGILAGVVIMDLPTVFSHMLNGVDIPIMKEDGTYELEDGEEIITKDGRKIITKKEVITKDVKTRKIERLISRGACISWSPKNLGSSLIIFAINWMVKHTRFRLFVAYSDVEAKELGTIYQACSFYYLGKKSGAKYQYKTEDGRWVSDRYFRSRSVYKRLAKKNGIVWQDEWQDKIHKDNILFDIMPEDIEKKIKQLSKDYILSCEKREMKLKHKYAFVLGKNKWETKYLRNYFLKRNKIYPYPKERGT